MTTSNTSILTTADLATAEFTYSAPKKNNRGGSVMNMFTKGTKEWTTIATPLVLTWGAHETQDNDGNPTGKYAMSLQFPGTAYPDKASTDFYNGMKAVEDRIRNDVVANSEEWLGEQKSREAVNEIVGKFFHTGKDREKAMANGPSMSIKLPQWAGKNGGEGEWQSEIYDENRKPLFVKTFNKENNEAIRHFNETNEDENAVFDRSTLKTPVKFLPPRSKVMCVIQCSGIWFVGKSIYVTWCLKQALVKSPEVPEIVEGTCFIMPSVSDVEALKKSSDMAEDNSDHAQTASAAAAAAVCVVHDDSSDDENSDEEEESAQLIPKTAAELKKEEAAAKKAAKASAAKKK